MNKRHSNQFFSAYVKRTAIGFFGSASTEYHREFIDLKSFRCLHRPTQKKICSGLYVFQFSSQEKLLFTVVFSFKNSNYQVPDKGVQIPYGVQSYNFKNLFSEPSQYFLYWLNMGHDGTAVLIFALRNTEV